MNFRGNRPVMAQVILITHGRPHPPLAQKQLELLLHSLNFALDGGFPPWIPPGLLYLLFPREMDIVAFLF